MRHANQPSGSRKKNSVLKDVIAHHHDAVTHQSTRVRWLAQAECTAASMSRFHTLNLEQPWAPKRLEELLPPAGSGISLQYEDVLETVVRKVNETERSFL
jgi:Ni,Fe-hydrogenase I small subunit